VYGAGQAEPCAIESAPDTTARDLKRCMFSTCNRIIAAIGSRSPFEEDYEYIQQAAQEESREYFLNPSARKDNRAHKNKLTCGIMPALYTQS
jgi:hypothetical protein